MVQFCYLRPYFGIDNISRRLLQWIARIKNGMTTSANNKIQNIQQPDNYKTAIPIR